MSRPSEELIFDRTQQDVLDDTEKGQYNVSDLNRVESWCRYLADELTSYGYAITITTKTNWTQFDKRKATEMERIRSNIKKIMEGYSYLTNIEPNAKFFNYVKANNWEKILDEINFLMQGMANYFVYSGVSNAGQRRLYQNRFRHFSKQYKELSYIESTGTQYIFIGVVPNANTCTEIKARFPTLYTSGAANWVCFTYLDQSPNRYAVMSQDYSGTPFIRLPNYK